MGDDSTGKAANDGAEPTRDGLVDAVLRSYEAEPRMHHIAETFLPNRERVVELLELIRRLVFPGFFDRQQLSSDNLREHVTGLIDAIRESMQRQIDHALRYTRNLEHAGQGDACRQCTEQAREITAAFLSGVPALRAALALDVQAAYDGDPAARNTDEAVFCYPGVFAVFTHRVARELWMRDVPLIPRLLAEHAHDTVGIDIHPGATIGASFFIDHGTGVVIGETTEIGDRVKLYQGVTLGALSFPKDERGRLIRGQKRHPTIEDDVVIYAGATILGGQTIVGAGSEVGANVFLTKSVPPGHRVTPEKVDLKYRAARPSRSAS